jgi:hypothetical protein
MAFFYTSDVAQLAVPLDNNESLHKVMRTVHAIAQRGRLDSYQLLRLNYGRPHTPITHRYHLEQRP